MAPSDPSTFFSSPFAVCVSAKAVYGWFKEGNPQVTDAGHVAWGKVSGLQAEIGTLINKAVTESGAMWGGSAGDAMRSSTSPMATWADLTGASATSGSAAVAEISSAFRAAQNSVQVPVEVPDKPWYNDITPWDTDYDEAVDKSQGVDEANMRVINAYADRTNYATSNMPTFEAPADSTAEVDDESLNSSNSSIDKMGTNEQFTNSQTSSSSSNNSSNSNGSDEGKLSSFTPPGPDDTSTSGADDTGGDGTTRPSDVNDPGRPPGGNPVRPPIGTPGLPGDVGGGIVGPPFGPNDPRNPANKLNSPNLPGAGRGSGSGGGTGGGRGGLGGGLGGGGGGAGAGGLGAGKGGFGPGGAAAAAGQFGGAAGSAAGEAAARGGGFGPGGAAAGGRGAAGVGGAGAMGGHGAKGEGGDDLEHTSKYLQPSDEYFGDGTMVAPPVIGG